MLRSIVVTNVLPGIAETLLSCVAGMDWPFALTSRTCRPFTPASNSSNCFSSPDVPSPSGSVRPTNARSPSLVSSRPDSLYEDTPGRPNAISESATSCEV